MATSPWSHPSGLIVVIRRLLLVELLPSQNEAAHCHHCGCGKEVKTLGTNIMQHEHTVQVYCVADKIKPSTSNTMYSAVGKSELIDLLKTTQVLAGHLHLTYISTTS
jgi:hypothetical protein